MSLIKSISGIRGTIGGTIGENLTPVDTVRFTAAYGSWLKQISPKKQLTVVLGRDARISGRMVSGLVSNTLIGLGIDVKDLGLSTTPTVELAVISEEADGGVIITASHNPKEWNALKLLNKTGEFLNEKEGLDILKLAESGEYDFAKVDSLGKYREVEGLMNRHIEHVLELDLVDVESIKRAKFKVVLDAVNSTGGIIVPELLEKLGVECVELFCEPNGDFPHNPEPLKEHLYEISSLVVKEKANLGIVVDPDVDRLAIICEDGSMFGEEYTLVACADYVLNHKKGNTVSNLSSSKALKDITERHGKKHMSSAVGEVNVVQLMKEAKAVVGGEGNGGIIYPESHYGRDAIVGIGLFLSHLAKSKLSCKTLREQYPSYFMSKRKIEFTAETNLDLVLEKIAHKYENKNKKVNIIDGVKIEFNMGWVHLRKSNTEPIMRVYAESTSQVQADQLAFNFILEIKSIIE